jgi:TolA-binding protein
MEQDVAQLGYFERLWVWFETHKQQAAWGAGTAVVLGCAVAFIIWRQSEKVVTAGEALSKVLAAQASRGRGASQPVDEYLRVAAEHRGTPAGAYALLQAAAGLFEQGKYAEAQVQFQKFSGEYRDNPFLGQAALGNAACFEAQGKTTEAAAAYEDLIRRHSGGNVVPQAMFALARIFEAQNKIDQARNLYSQIVRNEPGSIGSDAAMHLEELNVKFPPPAPPSASAPAPAISPTPLTINSNQPRITTNQPGITTNQSGIKTNQP